MVEATAWPGGAARVPSRPVTSSVTVLDVTGSGADRIVGAIRPGVRRGNTVLSFLFNYTDTAVTDNQKGLLNARRLAEYAYALPRTRWNVGIDQRIRQVQLLGRLSYYGGWYDYDSGFGEVFIPSGGIDQGFFDGRPSIDVEASIELRENTMLMVGAQNMLDTYPQVSARATSVGEKYSEYTPWGFNGAYFYTRIAYTWDR